MMKLFYFQTKEGACSGSLFATTKRIAKKHASRYNQYPKHRHTEIITRKAYAKIIREAFYSDSDLIDGIGR